jgi:hypothetical protein
MYYRAHLASRSWFLILLSNKRNQRSFKKWLVLGMGQEIYKMSLEYLMVPEREKTLKKKYDD